jgi:hypothetical protein
MRNKLLLVPLALLLLVSSLLEGQGVRPSAAAGLSPSGVPNAVGAAPSNGVAQQAATVTFNLTRGTGTQTAYNAVSLALDNTGLTDTQKFAQFVCGGGSEACISQILIWRAATQTFQVYIPGFGSPLPLTPGQPFFLALRASGPASITLNGTQPGPWAVQFPISKGTGTNCAYNFISIPYDAGLPTNQQQLAASLSAQNQAVDISQELVWQAGTQTFQVYNPAGGAAGATIQASLPVFVCAKAGAKDAWPGVPAACTDITNQLVIPNNQVESSTWADGRLSLAIPLYNWTPNTATAVRITSLGVPSATYQGPTQLPVAVEDLTPGITRYVQGLFSIAQLPTQDYTVTVAGTFTAGTTPCGFQVQATVAPPAPRDPGPVTGKSATALSQTVATATYPPNPPPVVGRGTRENAILPAVPIGEPRNLIVNPPSASTVNQNPITPGTSAPGIFFSRYDDGQLIQQSLPPDPSVAGATAGGVAMYTVNTEAAISTDFGDTWRRESLTGLFPQDDGGLCCDQVVQYLPNPNLLVWLLQYRATNVGTAANPVNGTNRLRLAWTTPARAGSGFRSAWTWIDLTSAALEIGGDWMDYPSLSYSNNFVYVNVDRVPGNGNPRTDRRVTARVQVPDMQNCFDRGGCSVGFDYLPGGAQSPNLVKSHLVQSISNNTMYWAGPRDTSNIDVWSWPDNSMQARARTVGVTRWAWDTASLNALGPDNRNWNVWGGRIIGAAMTNPQGGPFLYFAWTSGRQTDRTRAQPYVRIAKINANTFARADELEVWNPTIGFSAAGLASGGGDELAMALAYGSTTEYARQAVGFWSDFVVYATSTANTTMAYNECSTNPTTGASVCNERTRLGDWFNVRPSVSPAQGDAPQGRGYSSLLYDVQAVNAAGTAQAGARCDAPITCRITPRYVQFGRPGVVNPPQPTLTLSPSALPAVIVGNPYNQALTASGAPGPYTFTRTSGQLPPGLNLSSGGVISGTANTEGTFNFTVTASTGRGATGSRAYSIQVLPVPGPR